MQFLISGYYGYDNAGDEAVLAAILEQVSNLAPGAAFVVTSGAPRQTERLHAGEKYSLRAVARDDFKTLWRELRECDLFISGGGSLLQDATSLRNIIYYIGLIRMAQFARKPAMVYAQGIGPLTRKLSQQLTSGALQHEGTKALIVRDPESKALLERIGVRREIEITADPVWALTPGQEMEKGQSTSSQSTFGESTFPRNGSQRWMVSLRSWLDATTPDSEAVLLRAIREAAKRENATLRFLTMQPERDRALIESLGVAPEEIFDTSALSPRAVMRLTKECDLMIAMRLHALIFAAAQGVPCLAISYDPKVSSLAKMMGAPVIVNASASELDKLQKAAAIGPPDPVFIEEMKRKARFTAERAVELVRADRKRKS